MNMNVISLFFFRRYTFAHDYSLQGSASVKLG